MSVQMIFGKLPFTMSQLLSEFPLQVEFPSDSVTEEAKEFIRSCLCDVRYRPDVLTLCAHRYLIPRLG